MSKYPLIESMGLSPTSVPEYHELYVMADDLEKALQDAPVVWGSEISDSYLMPYMKFESIEWQDGSKVIKGRIVCIQPLKKKTKEEAAIELLEQLNQNQALTISCFQTAIKKILEMPE